MIIPMLVIRFWDPLLSPVLLLLVLPFCVPSKPINDITAFVEDSSALVSQHGECNGRYKLDKVHYKYEHYHKLGHKIVRCYALHGHPPRSDLTIN